MAGDVVPQSSRVMKERETVTDLETEVNMTAILGVKEIFSVEVTIVNSLVITITRKMTAVRDQQISLVRKLLSTLSLTAFIQHSSDPSVRKTYSHISRNEGQEILVLKKMRTLSKKI